MAVLVSDAADIFRVESHFNRVDLWRRRQITGLRRRDHVERWRHAFMAMRGRLALQRFPGWADGSRRFISRFGHPLLRHRALLLFAMGAGAPDNAAIGGGAIPRAG